MNKAEKDRIWYWVKVGLILPPFAAVLHVVMPHGHSETICGGALEVGGSLALTGTVWGKTIVNNIRAIFV